MYACWVPSMVTDCAHFLPMPSLTVHIFSWILMKMAKSPLTNTSDASTIAKYACVMIWTYVKRVIVQLRNRPGVLLSMCHQHHCSQSLKSADMALTVWNTPEVSLFSTLARSWVKSSGSWQIRADEPYRPYRAPCAISLSKKIPEAEKAQEGDL